MNELQTTIKFADKHTMSDFRKAEPCFENMLVRQIISVDPIDGHTYVDVYTDDGCGNGVSLYRFALD